MPKQLHLKPVKHINFTQDDKTWAWILFSSQKVYLKKKRMCQLFKVCDKKTAVLTTVDLSLKLSHFLSDLINLLELWKCIHMYLISLTALFSFHSHVCLASSKYNTVFLSEEILYILPHFNVRHISKCCIFPRSGK